MTELPLPKTVQMIYDHYAAGQSGPRAHLGASQIGEKCRRKLWFSFHWAVRPAFPGRVVRLFETGNREEARVIENLRAIGIEVYDRDPETGKQIRYEAYGGHYAGSLDGIAKGFPEAPVTWHVIEIKTSNARQFADLQKNGVRAAKPQHFIQMQQYMAWSKLTRAYYFCVCKDTDEIYAERVEADPDCLPGIDAKVYGILSNRTPHNADFGPNSQECRFCDFKGVCHGAEPVARSCRTCEHVKMGVDTGLWVCGLEARVLSPEDQEKACDCYKAIEYQRD